MNKKTIEDINVSGKRVIVRVDFNVPLDGEGNITDDTRIKAALPTIKYLLGKKAKIILVSHLGRPKGEFNMKYSMAPASKRLGELLNMNIIQAKDVIGPDAKEKAKALKEGEILMLENVRFHKEEEANDPVFSKELADLAEVYVNDAFGTAHRAHASTAGIAAFLPAVAGFLMKKEIEVMGNALNNPIRPFVAILGGSKVSDKIEVINNLLDKVDDLIIGGGMAYTFLKAKGYKIGNSICENDKLDLARELMAKAESKGVGLQLPIGTIVANKYSNDAEKRYVPSDDMPDGWEGMDIGNLTIEKFSSIIKKAKTIIWNGPMGVFEFPNFANGTRQIAKAVAESRALSIVGGGDSAAALEQLGFADKITHISTGGGASLEFLEGRELPGVACLLDKNSRRTVIAGNWKMNKKPSETAEFINGLKLNTVGSANEIIAAVPFVCIPAAVAAAKDSNIAIAAQNMHWEEQGAYTGEVSGAMLKDAGVKYVIIGHSERRQYFAETDNTVNKKVLAAFKNGLKPIVCVGESLEQREEGVTADLVRYQVKIALLGLTAEQVSQTIIAYEPIWAIGTGKTATKEQANEVCGCIREAVKEMYGEAISETVIVQYGGSVTEANFAELFNMKDIDGGLVGGASLKLADFSAMAKFPGR
ncbi:MAG: triose-phosphate isomerase [Clostridiales bacterium]|jgi:triosephosphate isomerase|nr:triose-phosphate isomerase [Clostridiales bacterium]